MINRLTSNIRMTTISIKSIQSKLLKALVIYASMFRLLCGHLIVYIRPLVQKVVLKVLTICISPFEDIF